MLQELEELSSPLSHDVGENSKEDMELSTCRFLDGNEMILVDCLAPAAKHLV
jgi:hypothetical protein